MILETNGPLIAEKVTSHNFDADALADQVFQQSFRCYVNHLLSGYSIKL